MLWDEARQDKDTLAWYQRLVRLRRQAPVLTEGTVVRQWAEDGEGLLFIERQLGDQRVTLVFHTEEGTASLPELRGQYDLISGQEFSGTLGGYEAAVLAEAGGGREV